MFYHKSHWNVLLKKKKYIHIFFLLFPFFFFFRNTFCFHYTPPEKKKVSLSRTWTSAASTSQQPFPLIFFLSFFCRFFVCLFLKMHKEIHNSQLPFWFYKLIQSHMCYTGLELEHCKLYSWILLFSIVGYKKEQAT